MSWESETVQQSTNLLIILKMLSTMSLCFLVWLVGVLAEEGKKRLQRHDEEREPEGEADLSELIEEKKE